jgi:hypothetical protein
MMKAQASISGAEVTPSLRVGRSEDELWLDLGGKDWMLVKVSREGWELFQTGAPGVAFIRKKGMLPLPIPARSGDIWELRKFLNVQDEDFVLQVGWLIGALRVPGPYPLNILSGVPGSAKTTLCVLLQRMIDPNFSDLASLGSVDDLFISANNRHVPGFDNVSRIPWEMSDALCRVSTGAGHRKRQLWTDAEEFLMRVCRPILLNGIPADLAERGDLADRAIVVELGALDEGTQIGPEEFWRDFSEAQPRLLGALLDGVVGAMRDADKVGLKGFGRVRMSDFARWAEAGCRALGFAENEFLRAFISNIERAMRSRIPAPDAFGGLVDQEGDGLGDRVLSEREPRLLLRRS